MLGNKFDMKDLDGAKKILGMQTHRNKSARKLWLSQKSYVEKVISKFDISNSKDVNTPLKKHFKHSLDMCPKTNAKTEYVSKVPYASIVGCLMYLMICTNQIWHKLYVKFVSLYLDKRIFQVHEGYNGLCIIFISERGDHSIVGYVNSDHVGDMDEIRSITRYVFTLSGRQFVRNHQFNP